MSSNYPPGSMRGSGIFSSDTDEVRFCRGECDDERDGTLYTNDWGHTTWECSECGWEEDVEDEGEDPDDAKDRTLDLQWEEEDER